MRITLPVMLVLLLHFAVQRAPKSTSPTPEEEFEKILGRKITPESKALTDCRAQITEMNAWYQKTKPVHDQLLADYRALETRNSELEQDLLNSDRTVRYRVAAGFAGLAAGICIAFLAVKILIRVWPASPQKKQLIILVFGALWISVASVVGANDSQLSIHPVNLAFTVGIESMPAVLFSGIAFWWIEKTKQGQN